MTCQADRIQSLLLTKYSLLQVPYLGHMFTTEPFPWEVGMLRHLMTVGKKSQKVDDLSKYCSKFNVLVIQIGYFLFVSSLSALLV